MDTLLFRISEKYREAWAKAIAKMHSEIPKLHSRVLQVSGILLMLLVIVLIISVFRREIFGHEKDAWFEIITLLFSATIANTLIVYLKQPVVILQLLIGMLISPSTTHLLGLPTIFLPELEVVKIFAQLGAIILLFKIGLHNDVRDIFSFENALVAIAGVVFPFILGYYVGVSGLLGLYTSGESALLLGTALTATSVGITVAILDELKLLEKRFARILIGAAVIDDVLGLLVLSFSMQVAKGAVSIGDILSKFALAAIFVIGGITLGEFLYESYFSRMRKITHERFLTIMLYVFTYAYVAEFIGLSSIVGAFIAGLTLSKLHKDVVESIFPLEALFTPIFFITLGVLIDITQIYTYILPVLGVTLLAFITKILGCGLAGRLSGLPLSDSSLLGLGMVPRGEIGLIVALFGLTTVNPSTGRTLLTNAEYSVIATAVMLTTIITPILLVNLLKRSGHIKT
ncbi:MAG: cation:proton antiporter [Candidatus Micrarchaeia archaeon]